MMAHVLKSAGKTKTKIIILDPKESFSKQGLFQAGWEKYYPGMVEWLPQMIHGGIKRVDPAVDDGRDRFRDLQPSRARQCHPAPDSRTDCASMPGSPMPARLLRDRSVHHGVARRSRHFRARRRLIAGDMPKSAFSANSQAQVVAHRIAEELLGAKAPEAVYRNRCWSLIAENDSVFVGGTYRPTLQKIAQAESVISKLDDTSETRRVRLRGLGGLVRQPHRRNFRLIELASLEFSSSGLSCERNRSAALSNCLGIGFIRKPLRSPASAGPCFSVRCANAEGRVD